LSIQALQIRAESYKVALETPLDAYDDDNVIISTHLAELDNLPAVKNANDVAKLRQLILNFRLHIDSLEAMKVASNTYGALLTTRFIRKIPESLQMKWLTIPIIILLK